MARMMAAGNGSASAARGRSPARLAASRALLLAPLVSFMLLGFVLPVAGMLYLSIDNSLLPSLLPRTAATLSGWSGDAAPDESAFAALAADLAQARRDRTAGLIGKNLSYEQADFRSLIANASRAMDGAEPPFRDRLIALDRGWGEPDRWRLIRRATRSWSMLNLLAALDLKAAPDGSIGRAPPAGSVHRAVFVRTFLVSATVSALCLILGFPVAYLLAQVGPGWRGILLALILLPLWTSLLVRTTGWIVLLQNAGVINTLLVRSGLIEQPLPMMFNRVGVLVTMTHVLLPFMILPIYSAMAKVEPSLLRAAQSLGAGPARTFLRVYLPLVAPGLRAGLLIVFILALGYYVTPALVGGPGDQMISQIIAFHTSRSLNWGLAAALSVVLLATIGAVAAVMPRRSSGLGLMMTGR